MFPEKKDPAALGALTGSLNASSSAADDPVFKPNPAPTQAAHSRAIPPLLMLAEGRRPRLRKAPVVRPLEIHLHIAVAKILRDHARPDWLWTHIANGELRDFRTAAKLKAMGVRRGWPDFILVPPVGQLHCLELKRIGEGLTDDQEAFQAWCTRHGVPHSVARTFDEALGVLDVWGCLRIKIGGVR